MQLDITKIDERIQKLQEIKRIAADSELVRMLLEFIVHDDEWTAALPAASPAIKARPAAAVTQNDIDIVEQVMKGKDPLASGPWAAKRA